MKTSKPVNYFIFETIWFQLEAAQVVDGVNLHAVDASNRDEVSQLVRQIILPVVRGTDDAKQLRILWTFEYYLKTHSAPFGELCDRCQDLDLDVDDREESFMRLVGEELFGRGLIDTVDPTEYVETLSEEEAASIFVPGI